MIVLHSFNEKNDVYQLFQIIHLYINILKLKNLRNTMQITLFWIFAFVTPAHWLLPGVPLIYFNDGGGGGGGLSDFFGSEILAKGNFFGSERCLGPFYLSCSFIFRNKREKKDEKKGWAQKNL